MRYYKFNRDRSLDVLQKYRTANGYRNYTNVNTAGGSPATFFIPPNEGSTIDPYITIDAHNGSLRMA